MSAKKIPTLYALAGLIGIVLVGGFILTKLRIDKEKSSVIYSPRDLRISNVDSDSFTVSWTTETPTNGVVKLGTHNESLEKTYTSSLPEGTSHWVNITNLSPQTTYFFNVESNDTEFDNGGTAFSAQTGSDISASETSKIVSGKILDKFSNSSPSTIVYVIISGSVLSTITNENGDWVIDLGRARNKNLDSNLNLNDETLLEILVQKGPSEYTAAQIYASAARLTPPITLGTEKIYDFRDVKPDDETNIPNATIAIPETTTRPE